MADRTSLYQVLHVAASASAAEIDKAYRRRAREAHPDAGGEASAFHALSHAYAVLSHAERRAAYDATGYDGEYDGEAVATRAMNHIHALVASVLESDVPYESVDLVAAIRETLVKQKAEIADGVARIERQARRAEAMAARFRRAAGDNFIRLTLERRAAEARENADTTRLQEVVFARAIVLLADYSFERDTEPARPAGAKPPARAAPPPRR